MTTPVGFSFSGDGVDIGGVGDGVVVGVINGAVVGTGVDN